MCFNISLLNPGELTKRYGPILDFDTYHEDEPIYYRNAFSIPYHPVIPNTEPRKIKEYSWGLIPFWVKTSKDAENIRTKTMNARADTIFDKPSFRYAIKKRRCLIPADGFFEWRYYKGKNYPYYIYLKDHEIFSIAGIWEVWTNPDTEEGEYTFSVITCDANPLLEKIHNKKKRMPVILSKDQEAVYLDEGLSVDNIKELLAPIDESKLDAYTISKRVTSKTQERNVPETIEPYEYSTLPSI